MAFRALRATIKSFLPQTLLGRSILILVLPVLILQIFTIYMFFDRHWSKVTSRLAFAVAGEIAVMADSIEHSPDPERTLTQLLNYTATNLDMVVSFDSAGKLGPVIATGSPLKQLVIDTLSEAMVRQVRRPFTVQLVQDEEQVEIKVQLDKGVLNIIASQRRLYSSSSYIFLMWIMGTSVLMSMIAIFFMRKQIRPIRRLAVAAECFGKGQDFPRFKPEGAREVRAAARAFLDMHDRIKRQVEQRTAMLAGISHDLRTPLTRLKLGLSLMPEGPDVMALKEDVRVMEDMTAAYLDFIRGQGDEPSAPVDLTALILHLAQQTRRMGPQVEISVDPNLTIVGREGALSRALSNILNNAARYGKQICVTAIGLPGGVDITIEDNGPGIPSDRYADAFRPFVRLDAARPLRPAEGGGHVGLGLSIAQDLIQSHGGQITLGVSEGLSGLKVSVHLPA